MCEPSVIPLRSPLSFTDGKREEVLSVWQEGIDKTKMNIQYGCEVTAIEGSQGDFTITLNNKDVVKAEFVFEGIFNGVGTQHINNKDFTKTIAKVLKRPCFLPNIPAFVIKTALGERADIALRGNKASADKLKEFGFQHKYTNLEFALNDLLK